MITIYSIPTREWCGEGPVPDYCLRDKNRLTYNNDPFTVLDNLVYSLNRDWVDTENNFLYIKKD